MKIKGIEKNLMAAMLLGTVFLAGCGGDDSLSTVEKNHEPDYEFKSNKEFADYPCGEVREGQEAVVGSEKDS